MTAHFRSILSRLSAQPKEVAVALNMGECVLRNVGIPKAPLSEQRILLRRNPKAFFQMELADYDFDCCPVSPPVADRPVPSPAESGQSFEAAGDTATITLAKTSRGSNREIVFAMGAPAQHIAILKSTLKALRLKARVITCTQGALVNAAATTLSGVLPGQTAAVVDIGFKHTSLSILIGGVPVLTRVAHSGGDTITANLAEAMNVEYAAAEAVKLTMPEKVEKKLHSVIESLAKELRSALDFFEETHGSAVSKIYFAGGTSKSRFLVGMLEAGLGVPCEVWNATQSLQHALTGAKASELKVDFPQLTTAVGIGLQGFEEGVFELDFLAEARQLKAQKRRDPIRWLSKAATMIVVATAAWAGVLLVKQGALRVQLSGARAQLEALQKRRSNPGRFTTRSRAKTAWSANCIAK